jgi:hypothetical protein
MLYQIGHYLISPITQVFSYSLIRSDNSKKTENEYSIIVCALIITISLIYCMINYYSHDILKIWIDSEYKLTGSYLFLLSIGSISDIFILLLRPFLLAKIGLNIATNLRNKSIVLIFSFIVILICLSFNTNLSSIDFWFYILSMAIAFQFVIFTFPTIVNLIDLNSRKNTMIIVSFISAILFLLLTSFNMW